MREFREVPAQREEMPGSARHLREVRTESPGIVVRASWDKYAHRPAVERDAVDERSIVVKASPDRNLHRLEVERGAVEGWPVEEWPVELRAGQLVTTDRWPVRQATVYRLVEDRSGRKVLREQLQTLDRATFERALDHALEKGLEVLIQQDKLVPDLMRAVLKTAQSGQPLTLHAVVNGIPATLANASGEIFEGMVKLCGMRDTPAHVTGTLIRGGLRFLFEPLAAPLKVGVGLIEVVSLVLPGGERGDPQVIENLIMGWIKDAKGQ